MTTPVLIIYIVAVILAFGFGRCIGRSEKPFGIERCYTIMEAFSLEIVYCTISATIHARHGNWKYLDELADILAGVHSHRLCYEEALYKLQELYKKMKGAKQ